MTQLELKCLYQGTLNFSTSYSIHVDSGTRSGWMVAGCHAIYCFVKFVFELKLTRSSLCLPSHTYMLFCC